MSSGKRKARHDSEDMTSGDESCGDGARSAGVKRRKMLCVDKLETQCENYLRANWENLPVEILTRLGDPDADLPESIRRALADKILHYRFSRMLRSLLAEEEKLIGLDEAKKETFLHQCQHTIAKELMQTRFSREVQHWCRELRRLDPHAESNATESRPICPQLPSVTLTPASDEQINEILEIASRISILYDNPHKNPPTVMDTFEDSHDCTISIAVREPSKRTRDLVALFQGEPGLGVDPGDFQLSGPGKIQLKLTYMDSFDGDARITLLGINFGEEMSELCMLRRGMEEEENIDSVSSQAFQCLKARVLDGSYEDVESDQEHHITNQQFSELLIIAFGLHRLAPSDAIASFRDCFNVLVGTGHQP